jgi:2-iminobutanoate/2-iminopropanoate deaminase
MGENLFIAHNPDSVWQVPDTFRPIYSHAVEVCKPGRVLFISGQFGVAPDGHLDEDFAAQCEQAMDNVESLLATAGMNITHLVKLTYSRELQIFRCWFRSGSGAGPWTRPLR